MSQDVIAQDVTPVEKIRRLPWSIATDAANMAFFQLTFAGSVFVLFLNELGLGKGETGIMLSLLPFAGILAVFVAPRIARFGYKRTFLTFFSARNVIAALLLFIPWVVARFGQQMALYYVTAILALFGLARAVGLTAYFTWIKEFVPDHIRGKFTAINSAVGAVTGFLVIVAARFVLERMEGLTGFLVLIGAGVAVGLVAIFCASRIPGGAPAPVDEAEATTQRDLKAALQDPDFRAYLIGAGLYALAVSPLFAFLPLFMQEEVGLSTGDAVLLQTGTLLGGLLTGYLWGWLADRYGSKPVLLAGLCLTLLLPVAWVLMPRQNALSLVVALVIAFVQGIAGLGWQTGSNRLLYVNVIPPEKKADYMALYFAWMGFVGGLGQLLAGWLLAYTQNLRGQWGFLTLDPYLPLFVAGGLLPVIGLSFLRAVRTDDAVTPTEFVNLFLRGNALVAMEGLIGLHLAKDEQTAIKMTERLGQADSLLAVDELIEALSDPRFWVRFEALLAIAHLQPDERLRNALVEVLNSGDPVLSVVAAWALGRMGDRGALEPLLTSLDQQDQPVKEYSIRSLGILKDHSVVPVLLERMAKEPEANLQLAYAAALGQLRVREAIPQLSSLLRNSESEMARMELSLALARIVGEEHNFIQLLRQANKDAATTTSQKLLTFKKRVNGSLPNDNELLTAIEECADTLGRAQMTEGVEGIRCLIDKLPRQRLPAHCCDILQECMACLEQYGSERMEYVALTLHTLDGEWQQ